MKRREFIALLGGTAFASPHSLWAQQSGKIPRIGIIDESPIWNPFREDLRALGYLEGQNIAFEYRYAGGLPDRLVWVAADLVRHPVDLIATSGTPAAYAAKHATTTIPIVMIGVGDPVGAGLVSSLARPGGNVTGNTILGPDVAGKRLQLLMEAVPHLSRIAFLWNPDNASHPAQLAELQKAVQILRATLLPVPVRNSDELLNALNAMMKERPEGFLMTNDPLHQLAIGMIIDFLANSRIPGMYISREIVMAGGFLSYGPSLPDLFRRGAGYAHRILQGAKPADLPVEQPFKFELAINLKTAKAMGLDVPSTFLARADEVIE
jgi:putative tryptophan/tyrosine transport system substrate-binding protein